MSLQLAQLGLVHPNGQRALQRVSLALAAGARVAVIGPSGEAHGVRGLFLADSSIFPTSLGVNPQLTTMVMATAIGRALA